MKKTALTLCKGFTGIFAACACMCVCAWERPSETRVNGETAFLSSLVCESAELGESYATFTAFAEGTEGFEYTVFTGTVEADGEEKPVSITVLDGSVEFSFFHTITDGYFVVNADTVYSNGVNVLQFECGYVCDFYAYATTPVSVLYNPEWKNADELTATCGALLYGEGYGAVSGYAEVDGQSTTTSLTVDAYAGTISFAFASVPEKFTVRKNSVFIGEGVAFRFDVSYLFDVTNARVSPSEATVTVYDGDEASIVSVDVGSTVTLPTEGEGKGLIGFFDGETLYPVGGTLVVESSKVFQATYLLTVTENAASARLEAPYGIRFTSSFSTADHVAVTSLDGVSVSFGAEIFVDGSEKVLSVPTDPISLYEKDGRTYYHTAIVNIQTKNFALAYECRPYVTVTYPNGETSTVYGTSTKDHGGETGRSYAQVIAAAYAERDEYDEETQSVLENRYEEIVNAVGVHPVLLVYRDGERTDEFNAELTELLNGSAWKLGDGLDLTAFFENLAPSGYVLGENSVLKGEITNRGLTLEIYYQKA